ncbi:MAG: protein kinase [Polyangiaceae bacterium]|nr:protein kinase [Polyangiaceae bacterium]
MRTKVEPPSPFLTTIMAQVLHGLHAAHEARTERGEPLCIVHRDVSPQNILIGSDGVPRVLDFGVAKAAHRVQSTRDGQLKGKLSYMSPEQILGEEVDRRTDIYAAAVVLWEAIAGRRLYEAENDGKLVASIVAGATTPPSKYSSSSNPAIDAVVMKGLAKEKNDRFATAREFAIALEKVAPLASSSEIGVWVDSVLGEEIAKRTNRVEEIESFSDVTNLRIPSKPPTMRVASRGPANTDDQGTAITGNENGPLSAVTSLSSAKSLAGIPAGPKKWWIPAVALFVLGSGSLFFALRSGSKPETSLVPSKPAPEPTVGTIPKPDLSATPAPETNPAASASVAANSATPPLETKPNTGVVQKTTVQKTTKRVETTKVVTSAQPVATAASPNCTPPWFLDEDGIKHVKPGCSR